MKHTLIILVAGIMIFASCTKTKTNTVTVTKYDTTVVTKNVIDTVVVRNSLVGKWKSDTYTNLNPTFTLDSMTIAGSKSKYFANSDSIYQDYTSTSIAVAYGYFLSTNNDTLTLSNSAMNAAKFYRQ